jgi:hypothetical protein
MKWNKYDWIFWNRTNFLSNPSHTVERTWAVERDASLGRRAEDSTTSLQLLLDPVESTTETQRAHTVSVELRSGFEFPKGYAADRLDGKIPANIIIIMRD